MVKDRLHHVDATRNMIANDREVGRCAADSGVLAELHYFAEEGRNTAGRIARTARASTG